MMLGILWDPRRGYFQPCSQNGDFKQGSQKKEAYPFLDLSCHSSLPIFTNSESSIETTHIAQLRGGEHSQKSQNNSTSHVTFSLISEMFLGSLK